MRRLSVSTVVAGGFTLLIVLAVGGVLAIGYWNARANTQTLVRERASVTLFLLVDRLLDHMGQVETAATAIRDSVLAGEVDPRMLGTFNAFVQGTIHAVKPLDGMVFVDPELVAWRHLPNEWRIVREDWHDRPAIVEAMTAARASRGARWLPPQWSPDLQQTLLPLVMPLYDARGFQGIIVAAVLITELSRFVDVIAAEIGQRVFVLYDHDRVLAHPLLLTSPRRGSPDAPLQALAGLGDPVLERIWDEPRLPLRSAERIVGANGHRVAIGGEEYVFLYVGDGQASARGWLVGTYVAGGLNQEATDRLRTIFAMGIATMLLAAGVSLWLSRVISRPVGELARAARTIRSQDFDQVAAVPRSRVREFDQAADAFNAMVAGLRDRQRLRDLFGRYVTQQVAEAALADPAGAALGGDRRDISVVFTDISGFTKLSEERPPEQVLLALNDYFEELCARVDAFGGVVVDFIGDAVFAIFGAPIAQEDHAERAVACARSIHAFAARFAAERRAEGLSFGQTRIGVHGGVAIVGNLGAPTRLKYGAMGDVVNTGARLQAANKAFSTRLLASRHVATAAGETASRPVGDLSLRGRRQPLEVVELLDPGVEQEPWLADYGRAWALLCFGTHAEALAAFRALAASRPGDGVIALHLARLTKGLRGPGVLVD